MLNLVTINGLDVKVNDKILHFKYPILNAFSLKDKLIVIYRPESSGKAWGQFENLEAYTFDGQHIWTAELPTNDSFDCYYGILTLEPLEGYTITSYTCKLDPQTGKIIEKVFTK